MAEDDDENKYTKEDGLDKDSLEEYPEIPSRKKVPRAKSPKRPKAPAANLKRIRTVEFSKHSKKRVSPEQSFFNQ